MLVALGLDALIGWPDRLYARIGHPVSWLGRLISALEQALNRCSSPGLARRALGGLTVALVLAAAIVPALAIEALLPEGWSGMVLGGIIAWPLVAARSLHAHVAAVAAPLARGDIAAARTAVAMIVGRDPIRLDGAGIVRAGLESLAENASDGVVAPLFWGALAGLPGIAAYKAINTMDSMIGHRTPRFEEFGKVAARLDDLANLLPARLTALLFAAVAPAPTRALQAVRRDARRHRSPNAGWPEAAMAGALGVRLSGPRIYADRVADEPWINAGAADPDADALTRGLALYVRAMILSGLLLAALAALPFAIS